MLLMYLRFYLYNEILRLNNFIWLTVVNYLEVKNIPRRDGTGPRSGSRGPRDGRGQGKGRAPGQGAGKKKGGKKGRC